MADNKRKRPAFADDTSSSSSSSSNNNEQGDESAPNDANGETKSDQVGQPTEEIKIKHYVATKPNQFIEDLPDVEMIWEMIIIPMFTLKELAMCRPISTFFEPFWTDRFENNKLPLRVPQDCLTIKRALCVGEILNERRPYTKTVPLKMVLGEGTHTIPLREEDSSHKTVNVRFSVSIVGQGIDKTTINGGGFLIKGQKQDHVSLKKMKMMDHDKRVVAVHGSAGASFDMEDMNIAGYNTGVRSTSTRGTMHKVEVLGCLNGLTCGDGGILTSSGACSIHHNDWYGMSIDANGTINLVQPLTKETVSTNNGANWGGDGKICIVDNGNKIVRVQWDNGREPTTNN